MHHASDAIGYLTVQPPLNEIERDHLRALLRVGGTLRGSVTGRGDAEVPFARLGWVGCADGCCLAWDPALEEARWMGATLRYVVDHLLRSGAKAEGHDRFAGFTFDHVVAGAAIGRPDGTGRWVLALVEDNVVTERIVEAPCGALPPQAPTQATPTGGNVIAFRPRGA